jgi:hypothetical protein
MYYYRIEKMLTVKIVILLIVLTLNIWVWFFGKSFIHFFITAEKSPLEKLPSQKEKWKVINHPQFIWYPRIMMTITLILVVSFILLTNT